MGETAVSDGEAVRGFDQEDVARMALVRADGNAEMIARDEGSGEQFRLVDRPEVDGTLGPGKRVCQSTPS